MVKTLRGKILLGTITTILILISMIDVIVIKVLNSRLQNSIQNYMNMMCYVYINEFRNIVILNDDNKISDTKDVFMKTYNVMGSVRDNYVNFKYNDGKEGGFLSNPLNADYLYKAKKNDDRYKVVLNINFESETIATYTYPTYINDIYYGTLFIQADFNKEYNERNSIIKFIAIGEVITVITVLVMMYLLLRRLIKPIQTLCNYMNKFSSGAFVEDIKVTSSSEAQYLYDSFNKMKNEISTQIDIIKAEKKKVEELQASTKKFFDNVTHEMKTPIAAISGYTQLLMEDDLDIETSKRALERIMLESNKINNLVSNILDISKGKNLIRKEKESFYLGEFLEDILVDFQVRLSKNDIIVDKYIKNLEICGVKEEIKQVIINLIDNSIKYNSGNKIEISLGKENELTIFKIKNPCGKIDESLKDNIFKPFVKYTYDKVNVSSTGLGLYICKELVERNRGEINYEFSEGYITFVVKLTK